MPREPDPHRRGASSWCGARGSGRGGAWALVLLGSLGFAAWVTLSEMVRFVHADTLIPVLVSLQRWTWFYWGQDRGGMLLPALAMPIRHPLINLLFQNGVNTYAALLVLPLLQHYLRRAGMGGSEAAEALTDTKPGHGRRGGSWGLLWVWAVGVLSLLVVSSSTYQHDLLLTQPYALGLCLGLAGLIRLDRSGWRSHRRRIEFALGVLLLGMGLWVNLAGAFVLAPLWLGRWVLLLGPREIGRRWRRGLTQAGGAAAAVYGAAEMRQLADYAGEYGWLSAGAAWDNAAALATNGLAAASSATGWVLLGLVLCGAAGALVPGRPPLAAGRCAGEAWWATAVCLLAAAVYGGIVSANAHVLTNGSAFRYTLPMFLLLLAAAAIVSAATVARLPPTLRLTVLGVVLSGSGMGLQLRYGPPSYASVRHQIDQRFGQVTDELLATRSSFVMGQYWDVWHAVFHVNLVLHERGEPRTIYGIADRGDAARDRWLPLRPEDRVAVRRTPESENEVEFLAQHFALPPLRLGDESPQLRILRPVADR